MMKLSAWFAISTDKGVLRCAECDDQVTHKLPASGQEAGACPVCGVECIFLSFKGRTIQVLLDKAPLALARGLLLVEKQVGAHETAELMDALEQLADEVYGRQPAAVAN